ncbi:MAG: cytochrome c maturation protein CcmE [Planctomycetota bacterium]
MRIWIPALVIVLALSGLITMGILEGGIPEVQVRELLPEDSPRTQVKVQGIIKRIDKETRPLRFQIHDREDENIVIDVVVDDTRPDVFKEGNDVAVVGIFDGKGGVLQGEKIYTKCPSKYEASQEADPASPGEPRAEATEAAVPPPGS